MTPEIPKSTLLSEKSGLCFVRHLTRPFVTSTRCDVIFYVTTAVWDCDEEYFYACLVCEISTMV